MKTKMRAILIISFLVFAQYSFGQTTTNERKVQFNIDKYGLALQGYDPVSYFEGKAQKGSSSIFYFYKGIRYEFISQTHLEKFKASPERFEPSYGGWCAYAMGAYGEKVEIDPSKFKIVEGKLYLFYYSFINNTLNKWNEDERHLKIEADKNWIKINNKK